MRFKSLCFLSVMLFVSCSNPSSKTQTGWNEQQEIHFYKDCTDKLLTNKETEENAHCFCECCLLKLKESYFSGEEAMKELTDEQITRIESDCQK